MITVLKENTTKQQRDNLIRWFEAQGLKVHISEGEYQTVLGLVGDTSRVDDGLVEALEIVERVTRVTESYKAANRKFHPEDTVVSIGDVKIGGGRFAMIAGPCSVESESQILEIAQSVSPDLIVYVLCVDFFLACFVERVSVFFFFFSCFSITSSFVV